MLARTANQASANSYVTRAEAQMRVGLGYDVHAFAEGRPLIIGGVTVPHSRGLDGHSDADVLAHALSDAILGAVRAGDIGQHFPDTDVSFSGADSLALLSHVGTLMAERGFSLEDADCVIVAQEPKLSPFRDEMRSNLARALSVPVDCIGLKATTTEHLGFEGRGEGIGAHAVVLLRQTKDS